MSSFARTIDWLDDRMNPIVVKELRQSMQSRLVLSVLLLFLIGQLAVVLGMAWYAATQGSSSAEQYLTGRRTFLILHVVLFGTCMLFVPASAAVRMSAERSRQNADLVFITTLSPWTIVWGKFLSAMILMAVVFSVCAPFLTFTYFLRGIDMGTIFLILGLDAIAIAVATMIGIFMACTPRAPASSLGVVFGMGFPLLYGTIGMMALTVSLLEQGSLGRFSPIMSRIPFGLLVGALLAISIVVMELLFVLAAFMLSPRTANRAPPVRLSLLAAWLGSGAIAAWISFRIRDDGPLFYGWLPASVGIFCLAMLLGVSERQQWGPRVASRIPRSPALRFPAFFTYSGASCGLTYSVAMIGLTLAVGYLWLAEYSPRFRTHFRNGPEFLEGLAIISLYFLCYSLSAMLINVRGVVRRLKPADSWIVAILLMTFGISLPLLIWWVTQYYQGVKDYGDVPVYWLLPNPFAAAAETNRSPYWVFVLAWTTVMAALSCRWYVLQLADFRPYEAGATEASHPSAIGRRGTLASPAIHGEAQ